MGLRKMSPPVLAVFVLAAWSLSSGGGPRMQAAAAADSLPSVTSGALPGPDVLYAPPPDAPQLENRDARFRASPILVSGHEAYVDGEYLYQDWLYDDNGSDSAANDAGSTDTGGDLEYPTDRARYGGNAADLVELRIAPTVSDVAYRFTLNTLLAPDSTMIALAFDTDRNAATGASTLPRDPGFSFPGTDEMIVTWGPAAEHVVFTAAGNPSPTALASTVDLEANQITVVVPRTLSDPSGTWKAIVGVGLRDPATGGWLRPQAGASATRPGGAGPLDPVPSAIFNLGFRFDEAPAGTTPHDAKQSVAIRQKAPGSYQRAIDFDALAAGESRTTVPPTGTMTRIFASRLALGEGKDYTKTPELLGQLQSYSIYVPSTYRPGTAAGLTLDLHSLGEHHWQYNGSKGVQQIGEQRNNIVITCECRGEDGWYQNEAEYDVFEMWNDVASHYTLDPDRVAITGYSMGGYATYRLATLYPDLFGRAFSIVGPPADGIWMPPLPPSGGMQTLTNVWLENARNVPFLNAVAVLDELVPITGTRAQNLGAPEIGVRGFDQLGYRFRFVTYPTAEHLTLAVLSYDLPYGAAFLGDSSVDRNPDHVTFTYAPSTDDRPLGLVHDHAYWVSGIELADPEVGQPIPKATVDAVSHAAGRGDPTSTVGTATGTAPLPYTEVNRSWGAPPSIPGENKLTVRLDNVGTVRIDALRAGLDAASDVTIALTSSSPASVVLTGQFPSTTVVSRDGAPVEGAVLTGGAVTWPVPAGASTFVVRTGGFASANEAPRSLPATGAEVPETVGAAFLTVALALRRLRTR